MVAEWNDRYSVGVEKFDDQHQQLFNIINNLEACEIQKLGNARAVELSRELRDYTVLHFGAEERALQKYGYPKIDIQKGEHEKFREFTRDLYTELYLEKDVNIPEKLTFLTQWLFDHIGKEDKAYSKYFTEQGIEVAA